MIPEKIKDFLIYSAKFGYGNESTKQVTEADGSTTIEVEQAEMKLHDNYFGGEPYGGRTIISENGKPEWIMVYYGKLYKPELKKVIYSFLKKNLINPENDLPVRGPKEFREDSLSYVFKFSGIIEEFSGIEEIYLNKELVFKTSVAGGLVDQK